MPRSPKRTPMIRLNQYSQPDDFRCPPDYSDATTYWCSDLSPKQNRFSIFGDDVVAATNHNHNMTQPHHQHGGGRNSVGQNSRSRQSPPSEASDEPPFSDVARLFQEFANGTSMHGVPRIINARSLSARIFWSIICVGAFGMFFWQCGILLQRYFSYPKKVNVEIVQKPVPFPYVTVCNTDHLDLLVVDRIKKMLLVNNSSYIKPGDDINLVNFFNNYSKFQHFTEGFFWGYSMHDYQRSSEHMLEAFSRFGLTANLGPELASVAGVKLEDFIIHCRFMNDDCNISTSFFKYFDTYYYNCFTFKPGSTATLLRGVGYGLSLLLFTGSSGQLQMGGGDYAVIPGMEESDSALASGRGARVVVHSPGTEPHPTAEGFDVPPAFSVTIGVKARENARIHVPHGNCTTSTQSPSMTTGFNYTLMSCQNDCLQKAMTELCSCVDNRITFLDGSRMPYCLKLPSLPEHCLPVANQTSFDMAPNLSPECVIPKEQWGRLVDCKKQVYVNLTKKEPSALDKCLCYPPCNDMIYDSYYSISTLPERSAEHTKFYMLITKFLQTFHSEKKQILLNKARRELGKEYSNSDHKIINDNVTVDDLALEQHVTRLNVHIADSNIIKTTEAPDYEAIRLVSDIGGQLGLWIGISVITLFEVIQLILDVIRFIASKGRQVSERKMDRVSDSDRGVTEFHYEIDKLTAV